MNNHLEIGKSLPENLKAALKEVSNQTDWTLAATAEGAVSPYKIRDIIKGFPVTEPAYSTILKLIEMCSEKVRTQQDQLKTFQKTFKSYDLTDSHA